MDEPRPPETYRRFIEQYPQLGTAWENIHTAGEAGPLDERTARLIKLAIAMGALREGAVRANVRKALAAGISKAEILQMVALAAGTVGMPASVALFDWITATLDKQD